MNMLLPKFNQASHLGTSFLTGWFTRISKEVSSYADTFICPDSEIAISETSSASPIKRILFELLVAMKEEFH